MPEQSTTIDGDMRSAATVVLLRDAEGGPEVLLLERPRDRGAFAGAWVFPGGSVDAGDRLSAHPDADNGSVAEPEAEERAARRAAVREVREETALEVSPSALTLTALWTPPVVAPRRFRTWFYVTAAPAGQVVLSPGESVDHAWMRPEAALDRHAAGALTLIAPTWVTLHDLAGIRSVSEALDRARHAGRRDYATRVFASEGGHVLLWRGDAAYEDDTLFDGEGDRHRLDIRALPWVYTRTPGG